jgi:ABC-type amino acid transport substrate-binding protein
MKRVDAGIPPEAYKSLLEHHPEMFVALANGRCVAAATMLPALVDLVRDLGPEVASDVEIVFVTAKEKRLVR